MKDSEILQLRMWRWWRSLSLVAGAYQPPDAVSAVVVVRALELHGAGLHAGGGGVVLVHRVDIVWI